MDEKTLGKRLQLARKRARLTQQELCQKAGLSYSTLAKIERGAIRTPSVFTVASIAAVTGASLEELLDMKSRSLGLMPTDTKQRSKNGVRFVYFDVNGTIVRYFERAYTEISQQANTPVEIVETMFLHYDGAACRGSMSNEEVEKIFAAQLGLENFSWESYYMENAQTTPGLPELLGWVAQNYQVGLLTNNWLGYTDELMRRGTIPKVDYRSIIESAKVGCLKPEAKIYELAQQLSGVEPNEILLVDDKQAYLSGAENAGWHSLWFDETQPEHSIEQIKQALAF